MENEPTLPMADSVEPNEGLSSAPSSAPKRVSAGVLLRNKTLPEFGRPADDDSFGTITFRELLRNYRRDRVELPRSAVFSTFVVDLDWVHEMMPPDIPYTIVRSSRDKEPGTYTLPSFPCMREVIPPLKDLGGIFHPKICLIFFRRRIRVVVSSANLDPPEWERLHQIIWFQDFRRLHADQDPVPCEFKEHLQEILKSWDMPHEPLDRFDFSTTSARLVVSAPGKYRGEKAEGVGHLRLRQLTREMFEETQFTPSTLIVQSSAVGSLEGSWREELLSSLRGADDATCRLKVVYPSERTVALSKYPKSSCYLHHPFPSRRFKTENEELLYPWKPAPSMPALLPHTKIICGLNEEEVPQWMYVGSHNFTRAAWGRRTKDEVFIIKNYEIGVWLPTPPRPSGWKLPFQWGPRSFAHTWATPLYKKFF